jgi:hypothetical protein
MARSEQAQIEAAAIKRHATVIAIKRQALGLAPISGRDIATRSLLYTAKRPRPIFIFPARYARLFRACRCLRVR